MSKEYSNSSVNNFKQISNKELQNINGGSIGSAIGDFVYFGTKGLRESGKLLNYYYKHKH
ncbi:ComC/BlpC family leader-containing pheromone/bacteriocin [Leuconostoc mesenteroides]|uniref:ComC/BlpC family leader-containing pheromone/bacteriocin n=1 Tax=Leuconostoc mesenteroides TaxID=1245 RepID=UPI00235E5F27|nr:ComC/BlpC family leader-containing pheromone/bacteriocin [Leuconostoc mesenteroides]